MREVTAQVLQAMKSNGFEVSTQREPGVRGVRGGRGVRGVRGTRLWLVNRRQDEEAFYYFDGETETQVIETLAWQYCTPTQRDAIFGERAEPALAGSA